MNDLAFIQWLQLADALAWLVAVIVFSPSVIAILRRRETGLDLLALPIILIGVNQMWRSAAWLLFPHTAFIPNQLFLWSAVHSFSILCAALVSVMHRRATLRAAE